MQQRLLILGSSLTALAVARVASRRGFEAVMLDTEAGPAAATRMARFVQVDATGADAMLDSIRELAKCDGSTALIADNDRWLRFLVELSPAIAGLNVRLLHPAPEALRICLDKSAFLHWCADQGLPAPLAYDPSREEDIARWAYPVLLRPQETLHSSPIRLPKAQIVESAEEMRDWLGRFRAAGVLPTVCESLVRPGVRQLSIGAARNGAGEVLLFPAEKIRPVAERCAGGTFVRAIADPGIQELVEMVLVRLDYFGVAEVEILFQPESSSGRLVEINARPWLQFGLSWAAGADLLGHVLGDSRPLCESAGSGASWIYFWSDVYQCFSRSSGLVWHGRLPLADYLRDLGSVTSYALWDRGDPWPFLSRALPRSLRVFRSPAPHHPVAEPARRLRTRAKGP